MEPPPSGKSFPPNHHSTNGGWPSNDDENFLLYGCTATCSLTLCNIRQVKPPGPLRGQSGWSGWQKFILHRFINGTRLTKQRNVATSERSFAREYLLEKTFDRFPVMVQILSTSETVRFLIVNVELMRNPVSFHLFR